jgi:Ca-activated chloride channel family protein
MNYRMTLLICGVLAVTGCNATREAADNANTPTGPAPTDPDSTRADSPQTPDPVAANGRVIKALEQEEAKIEMLEKEQDRIRQQPVIALADATAPKAPAVMPSNFQSGAKLAELHQLRRAQVPLDRENYDQFDDNPIHLVATDPVSTFSVDVDTAAYSNIRRLLNQGQLPRHDVVRVEEMINYFSYQYPRPDSADVPFSLTTEMGPSPWHADRHLLHIGIQGYEIPAEELPPANLVFLVDVSGSMQSPDKLELLKSSLKLLARQLDADDRLAIAVYAGAAGTVLEPTAGDQQARIFSAIDQLTAGGSTNGGAGIQLAHALAQQNLSADSINRVILATDGDFNVGTTNQQALKDLVAEKRRSGVALTVLGFGSGNYHDALMQELAQIGNGNAAYIDTMNEARKVLVDEMSQTLNIIARDVKIQLEFNPAVVREYRLIGYETRHLEREDFNNDAVDAGDIGAGHTVTAVYELALEGSEGSLIDPLRYGSEDGENSRETAATARELGFLKLRYKAPVGGQSKLISTALLRENIQSSLEQTSDNYRFSAAVAAFGQLLRGADHLNGYSYDEALALAGPARGSDPSGYRGEFLSIVKTAQALSTPEPQLELGQRN